MKKYQKIITLVLALCGFSSIAKAGSYQLNDYSVTSLGRAYSGVGVTSDDYSSIAFNPAGMGAKTHSGVQAGFTLVNLVANVDGLSGPGTDVSGQHEKMDIWVPIPNAFVQYHYDDKWDFGFGIYAPYGLETKYKGGWFGADSAVESTLTIVDLAPAISYKITDKLTIGGTFILRYIYGHMTNKLADAVGGGESDFELDGWTRTGVLGVMYQPTEDSRIGFSWRFRSTQQVKGDHKITNNTGGMIGSMLGLSTFNETAIGRASPALPETATLSFYQKIQKVGISATARWTHWSQSFPEFVMKSTSTLFNNPMSGALGLAGGEKRSLYNYDNTWTLALGADYYYNDNWTFRCGVAYDEGATHNATTRTYRIPDNDRYWTSVGLSYKKNNYQVDVGYSHLFVRKSKVIASPQNGETASARYDTHSDILGIQVQYAF